MNNLVSKCIRAFKYFKTWILYGWRFQKLGKRCCFYSFDLLTGANKIVIGNRVEIYKGARLEALGRGEMEIGDGTVIHLYFHCGAVESVKIGRDVLIAGRVYISDHDHEFDDPHFSPRRSKNLVTTPVVIEDEVWIGEGAVILKGVTVGRRAVIGANSVVTKDVPAYTVVAGVPARVIRSFGVKDD